MVTHCPHPGGPSLWGCRAVGGGWSRTQLWGMAPKFSFSAPQRPELSHGRVGPPAVEEGGGKPQVPAGLQAGDVLQDHPRVSAARPPLPVPPVQPSSRTWLCPAGSRVRLFSTPSLSRSPGSSQNKSGLEIYFFLSHFIVQVLQPPALGFKVLSSP